MQKINIRDKKIYGYCKIGLGGFAVAWAGLSGNIVLFVLGVFIIIDGSKDLETQT